MTSTAKLPACHVLAALALAGLALAGCASQGTDIAGPVVPVTTGANRPGPAATSPDAPVVQTVSQLPAPGAYQLTEEERGLGCKRLTGRMAVRIVQLRDYQNRSPSSGLARSIQASVKPMFGGPSEGIDPAASYARDRAKLDAYNQELARRQCPNFDLDAELAPGAKDPPRTRPTKKS